MCPLHGDILEAPATPRYTGNGHAHRGAPTVLELTPRFYGRPLCAGRPWPSEATKGLHDDVPARTRRRRGASRRTRCAPRTRPLRPRPRSRVSTRRSAGFVATWGSVWVEGEITSWNVRGGNVFGRLKDLTTDATHLVPHLVLHAAATARRPEGRRPRRRVRQGRLLRQDRRLQLRGLVDEARRARRSARAARAAARPAARGGAVRSRRARQPLPFLPHVIGLITGEQLRRREGRAPQRRAALAAGASSARRTPPCRATAACRRRSPR